MTMTYIMQWLLQFIGLAIYVWGARGENVCAQMVKGVLDPEGWIKAEEQTGEKAKTAIALFRARLAEGLNPIYAFDCSGLIVCMLRYFGILSPNGNRNSRGLYAMCNSHPKREELRHGDLVFRATDTSDPESIVHVGIYVGDGLVVECKGRAYGVVQTDINAYGWNLYGRLNKLAPFAEPIPEPEPEPVPEYPAEPLPIAKGEKGAAYGALQRALNLLGYKDANGEPLAEDEIFGRRSMEAWEQAVELNTEPPSSSSVTLQTEPLVITVDGMTVYTAEGGEEV